MKIVTDFWASFPETWMARNGLSGTSVRAIKTLGECLKHGEAADAVFVINCNPSLLFQLAAVFAVAPARRRPLISIDLVLRRPEGPLDYLTYLPRRALLRQVDHHVLYFTDLAGYERWFGVGPRESSFVDFKSSLWIEKDPWQQPSGEYVLCFGRSQRDWETFFAAMRLVPYQGAASVQSIPKEILRKRHKIPANVKLLEDNFTPEAQAGLLRNAKLVALPVLKGNLAASGLSTAFNALGFGKCVIGSEGPGFSDVFPDGEVLLVPQGDPQALAAMIQRAWEDNAFRMASARRGYEHAARAGGRDDLYGRIIDAVSEWHRKAAYGLVPGAVSAHSDPHAGTIVG